MNAITTSVIVIVACFVVATLSLPANIDQKSEIEIVPLEDQVPRFGDRAIVDTGVFGGGPYSNPFNGLFQNLEGLMTRMRDQMNQIFRRIPVVSQNGTDSASPFPGLHFPNVGDLGKGNSTSVTKMINGHKVVINETEYKHDGDLGGSFFKVRIIDVQPNSSEEMSTEKEAEAVTPTQIILKDRESVENSFENEIPKNKEIEALNFDNIETFDESPSPNTFGNSNDEWNNLPSVDSIESNSIGDDNADSHPVIAIDLSHDVDVNRIMADAGAPTNPDAEVFQPAETNYPPPSRISSMQYEPLIEPR